jgi:hypothetical protein
VKLRPWTEETNDNFVNPPPGPPADCTPSAAVAGCAGGSQGYVCTGDRPDDGDTNLVCSDGAPGAAGTTIYCCAPYGQYWSDCTVDTTIQGCVADAFGFRCTGPEGPADADTSLACTAGTASGSDTLYCCNSAALAPTCAPDPTISCASPAIGYSCTEDDSPSRSSASLACDVGAAGTAGTTQHCCLPFLQSPDACQEAGTPTGCAQGSYGFSCTGSTTPAESNPALQCGEAAPGLFCCDLGAGSESP